MKKSRNRGFLLDYQNFHQGFLLLKLLAAAVLPDAAPVAAALLLSAAPTAALFTLSFLAPF